METRELGRSGLQVPKLCLGANVFGWTIDEAASFRVLDAAAELGLVFIDTADVYSRFVPGNKGGESETIIGRWMKQSGKRDRIVLATKVGKDMGDGKVGLKPAYIKQAVADSLKRLQTDRIDLYQSHDDDATTPLAETLVAYGDLIKAGQVRAIGASNYTAPRLAEALAISKRENLPRYESLQPEYNLYTRRDFEAELAGLCEAEGLGVIPFYGLAGGFLTGKYRSKDDLGKSKRGGRVERYLTPRGMQILDTLDNVVARHNGASLAHVALAWMMRKPGVTPIASASSVEQVRDLAAATAIALTDADMRDLDAASAE